MSSLLCPHGYVLTEPTALGVSPKPPAGDEARPPHPLRKGASVSVKGCCCCAHCSVGGRNCYVGGAMGSSYGGCNCDDVGLLSTGCSGALCCCGGAASPASACCSNYGCLGAIFVAAVWVAVLWFISIARSHSPWPHICSRICLDRCCSAV